MFCYPWFGLITLVFFLQCISVFLSIFLFIVEFIFIKSCLVTFQLSVTLLSLQNVVDLFMKNLFMTSQSHSPKNIPAPSVLCMSDILYHVRWLLSSFLCQSVKETTSTAESSQTEVSQEVPLLCMFENYFSFNSEEIDSNMVVFFSIWSWTTHSHYWHEGKADP